MHVSLEYIRAMCAKKYCPGIVRIIDIN